MIFRCICIVSGCFSHLWRGCCVSMKCCPISYSQLLYKKGQDYLDMQYVQQYLNKMVATNMSRTYLLRGYIEGNSPTQAKLGTFHVKKYITMAKIWEKINLFPGIKKCIIENKACRIFSFLSNFPLSLSLSIIIIRTMTNCPKERSN